MYFLFKCSNLIEPNLIIIAIENCILNCASLTVWGLLYVKLEVITFGTIQLISLISSGLIFFVSNINFIPSEAE